jgi:hypothetical protein
VAEITSAPADEDSPADAPTEGAAEDSPADAPTEGAADLTGDESSNPGDLTGDVSDPQGKSPVALKPLIVQKELTVVRDTEQYGFRKTDFSDTHSSLIGTNSFSGGCRDG